MAPLFVQARPGPFQDLTVWLKADVGTYQDTSLTTPAGDTQAVGGWADQSGGARNVTQATAGNRPVVAAAVQNGLAVVRFTSASSHYLTAVSTHKWSPTGEESFFLAAANTGGAAADSAPFGSNDSSVSYILRMVATTLVLEWIAGGFTDGSDAIRNATGPGATFCILSGVRNKRTNAITLWKNGGTVLKTTTHTNPRITGTLSLDVGRRDGTTGSYLDGDIGELMLYPRALLTWERKLVEAYLGARWGVTVT